MKEEIYICLDSLVLQVRYWDVGIATISYVSEGSRT